MDDVDAGDETAASTSVYLNNSWHLDHKTEQISAEGVRTLFTGPINENKLEKMKQLTLKHSEHHCVRHHAAGKIGTVTV